MKGQKKNGNQIGGRRKKRKDEGVEEKIGRIKGGRRKVEREVGEGEGKRRERRKQSKNLERRRR